MRKAMGFIKTKIGLFAIIVAATAVGGVTTAVVSASIPDSSGTIHGCYKNKDGSLSVIDKDAGQSCTNKETAISWDQRASGGSSTALVSLNDDGTLDTAHSRGVNNIKLVQYDNPQYTPPNVYRVCFNLSTSPVWGTTSGGGYLFVSSSSIASDVSQVTQQCGPGYNAVTGEFGDPAYNPGASPYSSIRYIFWN